MRAFDTADSLGEPYPGLRPFRRDEAHIFFGRETTIDDMVERLAAHHFLAVTGLSGSGKSSLARTGLLDALDRGLLVEAGSLWRIADFRPGGDPLARLAEALLATTASDASAENRALTEAKLAQGPLGLVQVLDEIKFPATTNLLVLVDQFEEIFRYRKGAARDDVDAFVAMLLASANQRKRPIYVVITMRSDFLGECAQFANLAETINHGQFHTPRLTRDQCRQAIEEPARVYGGCVEEALVTRLLNDIGGNPDQLPLLQHVLMLLWQRARGRTADVQPLLTLADYESLGGVGAMGLEADAAVDAETRGSNGALSDHADRVLAELTSEQQRLAQILFRALTESDSAGDRAVRRPVSLAHAAAIADVPVENLLPVIEAFRASGRSFLMPLAPEPLKPETVLDISHESLIRQWIKLRRWVRDEYQSAEAYRGIERNAKRWKNGVGNLLMSLDLHAAVQWRKAEHPNAAWAQRYGGAFDQVTEFLRASERHRIWRRGLVATAIAIPVILIAGAFWFAFYGITMVLASFAFIDPGYETYVSDVKPQAVLKQDNIGSATPNTIPGGHVINTLALRAALEEGKIGGAPFVLIDALDGSHETIAKAERIPFAGHSGDLHDETQHQLEEKLKTLTGNKRDMPLVFFCQGASCWESYNACLRAIHLGYTHVYWYRGGVNSWNATNDAFDAFAAAAAAELRKIDVSKIKIKMTTVFSNIPGVFSILRGTHIQSDENQLAQPEPTNIDYYHRGVESASRGKADDAILDFNKAIIIAPQNAEAYYNRALAFETEGDYRDAMSDFLEAAALDPAKNAEVQAIILNPKFAIAYNYRGSDYYKKGDYDHAIKDYNQAIQLDPKYVLAYLYRADVYFRKGDYSHAISDYDQAIQLDPKNALAYTYRAYAYSSKGDHARAISDYDEAIRLDPKNVLAYSNRADAYSSKGDYAHAVSDYDEALRLDPENAGTYNSRCWVRVIAGQELERALSDCNESLRIRPNDADALDSRGGAYLKLGRLDEAIADFDAALKIEPKLASSLYGRGLAKLKKGDRTGADADMVTAKAIRADVAERAHYEVK